MLNRKAIVERHNPKLSAFDPLSPLSVGNGEFAFTADITGLQTFPDAYEQGTPLHTLSQWGWHAFPNPNNFRIEEATYGFQVGQRSVPYAANPPEGGGYSPAAEWLRANPHRLDLGRLGFVLHRANGTLAQPEELEAVAQNLGLWTGRLDSRFSLDGDNVRVTTVCHPHLDCIGVRVESSLLTAQRLTVRLAFPYALGEWKRTNDWDNPEAHQTLLHKGENHADFRRVLDADEYFVRLQWSGEATLEQVGSHEFELSSNNESALEFSCAFSPTPFSFELPTVGTIIAAAAERWNGFWQSGGAVDFSGSTDPRWPELERRVVLSQYVTAINCSGSTPPQETGLVCNSWHGKFHLEMHWWHAAQFALWNRLPLLEHSLGWYQKILPLAQENARKQGYEGARWPKMVAADGHDSPSSVGTFLIWQQPHPLYFAELCYRERPEAATLEQYREMVFETAQFMASYARWDAENQRYVLGPALIPAQESYGAQRDTNLNPTFELAYWQWALGIAQQWRERCGLQREAKWDEVRDHLAKAPLRDGIYDAIETPPYLIRGDHPSMLAALGVLPPTPLIDAAAMRATLQSVLKEWNWKSTWGWDYPMIAMTAARLGLPQIALDALLMEAPKNRYLPNGHNYQEARLPLYLPGNGGLLAAVAHLVADATPQGSGSLETGDWLIRWENLRPLL